MSQCWSTTMAMGGIVSSWRALLEQVPFRNDVGDVVDRAISGHSLRRTGAQWLARRGLPLWAIQYIGRWGSDSIRLYTAQAFADRHAELSRDVAAGRAVYRNPLTTEHWELVVERQK